MKHIAHIKTDHAESQPAADHCRNTARYASHALEGAALGRAAYLAGLVHDLGKYTDGFQEYILDGVGTRGTVIHSFQGCRLFLDRYHQTGAPRFEDITAELLAFAVGAHHGLFDCIDDRKQSGFQHRRDSDKAPYGQAVEYFFAECAGAAEIDSLFEAAHRELMPQYDVLSGMTEDAEEMAYYVGLLGRLLLSAVIEGDRRDTAEFMNDARFPEPPADLPRFWAERLACMEERLALLPQDTEILRCRGAISDRCKAFAERPCGIYRLNVPTGAGKTLSSLRFALAHAAKWGKERVIFTAPLLTILEQNAKVLRTYIGADEFVLEHHSNVLRIHETGDQLDEQELLTESWNASVIITSLVQLLNTLFSGKTTSIRRFHALCNSVIVIDEVQTVPNHMLTLFNLALNFLSKVCNTTFVLCSATQPCLEAADHPLLGKIEDLVPYDPALWKVFRRTAITNAGSLRLEQIPEFVLEKLETAGSLLVVCNKKQQAAYLFDRLSGGEVPCFHLSAAMCMAHRREVLREVERALAQSRQDGSKLILISTQVIEAGVDISFGCVVRLQAGMDSVVQSAGRCNRNGETPEPVPVYVLNCADERLDRLREIAAAKTATDTLLTAFAKDPAAYQNDLSSDAAITRYYRALYNQMAAGYQDFTTEEKDTLFSLLSDNGRYADEDCPEAGAYYLRQAFKKAGRAFQVFDDSAEDVVVPYGGGKALIEELGAMDGYTSAQERAAWLERAKPYTVSAYAYQLRELQNGGLVEQNGILILREGFYDRNTGLQTKQGTLDYLEV